MPRESLDAPENLPEQARRQVALGELQDEVPDMLDQASAGLEESLGACQRPALDGTGEGLAAQAEALVQLAGHQQSGIGGHRRAPELDARPGVEREPDRARCRVTHRVVPSAPARNP
jgi:hypothetical protein